MRICCGNPGQIHRRFGWAGWIPTLFEPRQFLTLTSEEEVFSDTLMRRYGKLLRLTNKALFGNHWHRHGEGISYAVGMEPQRGAFFISMLFGIKNGCLTGIFSVGGSTCQDAL